MNKSMFLTLTAIGLLTVVAQSGYAATPIDVNNSRIEWLGTKVTGQHNGILNLISGEVDYSGNQIKAARFVFDMQSITVLDIQDQKRNSSLVNHLKNDDFFAAHKFPQAIFVLSSAIPLEDAGPNDDNYQMKGDLTIKGITHAVNFSARVDFEGSKAQAQGSIVVDRTKYGITYKSGSIFQSLGDRAIHDEFSISFEVITQ